MKFLNFIFVIVLIAFSNSALLRKTAEGGSCFHTLDCAAGICQGGRCISFQTAAANQNCSPAGTWQCSVAGARPCCSGWCRMNQCT